MDNSRSGLISRLCALFVFLFVLVVYIRTMAASTSFWDCGEFIACSHILGIPHPPGAPLYILLGRLFSLLPLFETVARRVNFLSALTGALAAGTLFLVVERVARGWFGEGQGWRGRLVAMVGGVTAGLWMAFSDTFWSNTVEAEVYAPAMFLMVLATWFGLRWYQVRDQRDGDQVLLIAIYVLFLSVGVHMTGFLVAFPLFLFVLLADQGRRGDWRFWLVSAAIGVIVVSMAEPFLVAAALAMALSLVGMNLGSMANRRRWQFCFWLAFLGLVAFSVQLFIPLRSMLDPIIDENNPDSWTRFKMFLERKQYGQESMLQLMFHRKGSWANQFGVHPRMGFWGFFRQGWAPLAWWPLVLVLGLVGMVVGWFRERRTWWYLLVLMMLCSVGLVLWMNFSDGTRGVQLEVRDRDYFFTPTYVYFSLWMGLGVSGLLWLVLRRMRGLAAGVVFWVLAVVLLVGPLGTMAYNYHRHDRSRNYIARDYAYNLLGSCDRDGILFTNGDNDTFPLWYLQEVEGIRRDVRVANLSLLNTGWYIKQLNDMEPRVPTGYTAEQADALTPWLCPEDTQVDLGGISLPLKRGQVLRIQDRAVLNIIRANRWERPVYFAITVSPDNKLGLDQHLKMESMSLRVVKEEGANLIDLERSRDLIMDQHIFRSLNDTSVYKDDNTVKLLTNYAATFSQVGQSYCNIGQFETAREVLERGIEVLYPFWGIYQVLSRAYEGLGEIDKAIEVGQKAIILVGEEERPMIYNNLLAISQKSGRMPELFSFIEQRIATHPEEFSAYWVLFRTNHITGKTTQAAEALQRWLNVHPEDERTRKFLAEYRSQMQPDTERTEEDG